MGNLNILKKKEKLDEDEYTLEGLKFAPINNKTLRLYFEKQMLRDTEEDDIPYVMHIYELKVKLFYGKHYDESNLLDIDFLLNNTIDKLQGNTLIGEMLIEESDLVDKFLVDIFKFHYYTIKPDYITRYKSCKINENLRIKDNIFENINYLNVNSDFINELREINCVKIFIKLNNNPVFCLFAIKKFIEPYAKNLEKLKIYQANMSIIDQEIYTILAKYLRENTNVTKVKIIGKTIEDLRLKYEVDLTNVYLMNSKSQAFSYHEDYSPRKRKHNSSEIHSNSQIAKLNSKFANGDDDRQAKELLDPEKQGMQMPVRRKTRKKTNKMTGSVIHKLENLNSNNNNNINSSKNIYNAYSSNRTSQIAALDSGNIDINRNNTNSGGFFSSQKQINHDNSENSNSNNTGKNNDNNNHTQNQLEASSMNSESYEESEEEGSEGEFDFSSNMHSMAMPLSNESNLRSEHINKQHFILFFDSLAQRNNLLELTCFVFIKENHLVLISNVIKNNLQIRKLCVRNVSSVSTINDKELDISYHYYNSLGSNIKDEFYIFFNQINQLKFLETLKLTHFSFNSDINYLACQSALVLDNLQRLDLEDNQAIINNYLNVEENYQLVKSNLRCINFGNIYFHMIRSFDLIIHPEKMQIVNMGIFDSVSLSSFLEYSTTTQLEKIKLTLNKPCGFDTLELLLKILANHIFKIKNLKYFYLKNTYTEETYERNKNVIDEWVRKLFIDKMSKSKSLRKFSLNSKNNFSCVIPYFYYLKSKHMIVTLIILFVLQRRFDKNFEAIFNMYKKFVDRYPENVNYFETKYSGFKEKIFKRIILFISGKPRKIIL